MLKVASPPAFEPKDVDAAVLLQTDEVVDEGTSGAITVDAGSMEEKEVVEEEEEAEDDDDDSDYRPEDADEEDEEDEDEDPSLEMDDEEASDVYLKRMLEERDRIKGEDAAWVDRYIKAQQEWKEKHGTSIDEIDLDLRLCGLNKSKSKKRKLEEEAEEQKLTALAEAWNGRLSPYLPTSLRNQPAEFMVSLVFVGLFVVVAIAVQFYVAFKPALYS